MSPETQTAARAFVRSLNILLKFARLYEFGHTKTTAQFDTTWKELRQALEDSGGSGVLLGASGHQILLDGVPMGSSAGERSFAQLLTSSGIASIHFSPGLTQSQFARFVRAFPSGNAKPSALAEQLKTAMGGDTSIKVNEIRYVAEDSSVAGIKVAAQVTAKGLGAQGDKFREFFEDPNKMLEMILAAESARGGGGGGGGAGGPGDGPGGPGRGFGLGGGGMGGSGGGTGGGRAVAAKASLPLKKKMSGRCWDCLRRWEKRGKIRIRAWTCRRSSRGSARRPCARSTPCSRRWRAWRRRLQTRNPTSPCC